MPVRVRLKSAMSGHLAFAIALTVTHQNVHAAAAATASDTAAGPRRGVIEEIVVRARQREETLLEAPIAVTALSRETIDRLALNDLSQMANYIPNLMISYGSSGTASNMFMRGIGTGSGSAGFSSAVGLLIDGAYFERGRWINQGYFDLEQIEVLKGPQALYFGKNNTAGLIVMRTRDPGEQLEANFKLGNEFRADQRLVEGGVSVPITPNFGARLAARYSEQEGWIRNTSLPQPGADPLGLELPGPNDSRLPDTQETLARLTLLWTPLPELEASLKTTYARNEDNGNLSRDVLVACRGPGGTPQLVFGVPSPGEDCRKNFRRAQGTAPGLFAPEPDEFGDGRYFTDYESITSTLQLTYDHDLFALFSNTSFQAFEVEQTENATFSDDAQVPFYEYTDWAAWSQEVRLASKFSGPVNVLAGVLYTSYDLDFRNSSRIAPLPPDSRNGRLFSWDKPATEDGTAWSAYGEVTWDITPTVELATGTRYTREKKDSAITPTFVHEILLALGALSDQSHAARFEDSNWSPQATITWRPDDALTLFAAYREGFKSGGFDLSFLLGPNVPTEDLVFDSEEADGFEVGVKSLLLDSTLSLNVIAYRYNFRNLQVQQLDTETIVFRIGNAARARTTGVEADFTWAAADSLSLRGALAYNKAEYGEFFSACYAGQSIEAGCASGFDPIRNRFRTQDLAGTDLRFSPRWVAQAGLLYDLPLGQSGFVTTIGIDGRYSDSYSTATDRVPGTEQSSYVTVDATISVLSPSEQWEFSLIGRNLNDRAIAGPGQGRSLTGGASGVPAAEAGPLPDGIVRLQQSRQIWLQATWRM